MKKFSLFLIFFSFFLFADELNDSFSAAVQAGNVKTASEIFAKGADINFVDEEWPLFITAVTSNDTAMVGFFLKNGVNIELKGPDGKTALLHAISQRNKKLIEMLLAAGADLKAEDSSRKNVLMYAAEANNAELLKKLLADGFDRKLISKADKTALDYAIDARAQDCFRILSKLDTMPMDFINAVEKGDAPAVAQLIREGANVNTADKKGKAAIVIAVEKGHAAVLQHLLDNGADPNGRYFKSQKASLFVLAVHNKKYDEALMLLRFGAKANFDHRYEGGKTALMLAFENGKGELANFLMLKQFKVDTTDEFGNTALMYAVNKNIPSAVKKLLELGADPTLRQVDGKTALDIAKAGKYHTIMKMLEEAEKKWQ